MSSCQKNDDIELDAEEVKKSREEEILVVSKSFLMGVIDNLCVMDGISGHIDAALEIDRRAVILRALKEITIDIGENYGR